MQATFLPAPVDPRPRGFGSLLIDCLRRPTSRRGVSLGVVALLVAGIGLFAYPVFTDLIAHQRQSQLGAQFDNPAFQQNYLDGNIQIGQGLVRLQMPKIGVDVLVVQGVTETALEAGAGHYPQSPLPGGAGNVAIAGHRTTYGRPFNRLDQMAPGDVAILTSPFDRYTYRAVARVDGHPNPWVVSPDDYAVVGQAGLLGSGHWLTLTTCNPKGSNAQRLILRLVLVRTQRLAPPRVGAAGQPRPAA